MKDYRLSEIQEICERYPYCDDCPFCKDDYCIFACHPNNWERVEKEQDNESSVTKR